MKKVRGRQVLSCVKSLFFCALFILITYFFFVSKLEAYFSLGTGFNGSVSTVVELSSGGDLLVGGGFSTLNGVDIPDGLVRLNADGTLDTDTNFNANLGIGFGDGVNAITILPDGVLVGGGFTTLNSNSVPRGLVRLDLDGSTTTSESFNANLATGFYSTDGFGNPNATIYAIIATTDGIYVGGYFVSFHGANVPSCFMRIDLDGSTTTSQTFNANLGIGFSQSPTYHPVLAIVPTTDGIYVGGGFDTFNGTDIQDYFMRFDLDFLFLDKNRYVISIVKGVRPWRLFVFGRGKYVVEVPAWMSQNTQIGDRISFK